MSFSVFLNDYFSNYFILLKLIRFKSVTVVSTRGTWVVHKSHAETALKSGLKANCLFLSPKLNFIYTLLIYNKTHIMTLRG